MDGKMEKTFREEARLLPVRYEGYDIIVAGGGVAGIAAALAAARSGRRVLLMERMFGLGGLATLGLITIYLPLCDGMGRQLSYGIAEELLRLSISRGWESRYPDTWLEGGKAHGTQRFEAQYNPQVFAILAEGLLKEAGVSLLYGTTVCGVIREGDRLTGLIVENKDGRSAVPLSGAVDATGDADIFHLAGLDTPLYQEGNGLAAWYYETKEGANRLHMLGVVDDAHSDAVISPRLSGKRISGLDTAEITGALLKAHQLSLSTFLKDGEVSQRHSLTAVAAIPQLRMTRRIAGRCTLDEREERFEDSVGMVGDWRNRGPAYEIPLRCLYSPKLVNVAAAGRCISVTDAMWDVTRVIPAAAVTGQAAGTAVALAGDLTALKPENLQEKLRAGGVRLHKEDA